MESVTERFQREDTINKVLIQLEVTDKLKAASVTEIIELISKLCFQRGKTWMIARDFLLKVREGMRVGESDIIRERYHLSLPTFYYYRRKLMEMGLIEKKRGKYFLSEKFSSYMSALADAWDLVRRL